ncbi:hypothetical protein NP233_g767 [Leucocoprinus birnbaumii]|uniref:Uncharacterized protein n=1 Tax=Leucocoprinus birnbaumii TaxID=56174 RepID=A0AAD5YYG2_9AGAR|nr:hypothetical protein NP233_g767 [Leucocoprinus birnbaumii]
MPPSRTIKRKFPPLSLRCIFSPDREVNFGPGTLRCSFPVDQHEGQDGQSDNGVTEHTSGGGTSKPQKVPTWTRALRHNLGISEEQNSEIMALVEPLVSQSLDLEAPFGKQTTHSVHHIYDQLHQKLPKLSLFEDDWVCQLIVKTEFNGQRKKQKEIEL